MGKFVESNFHHYELLSDHFSQVKGYDAYAQKAEIARQSGLEGATAGFMKAADLGHAGSHSARAGSAPRGRGGL